jgi:hypothetical protein
MYTVEKALNELLFVLREMTNTIIDLHQRISILENNDLLNKESE